MIEKREVVHALPGAARRGRRIRRPLRCKKRSGGDRDPGPSERRAHWRPPESNGWAALFYAGSSLLGLACSGCGAELPAGSKFCNQCGTAVGAAASDAAEVASAPAAPQRDPRDYTPKHLADFR